jgi:hypothetical protein
LRNCARRSGKDREGHPEVRDLSLHLVDLIENSCRAQAAVISVTIEVSSREGLVTIRVEDDGPGFSALPSVVLDPFYTTKSGKRTGLGLSLFKGAAERAGGSLAIGKSPLGGASVEARMQLSHPDRSPLGDLAATFGAMAATNPDRDIRLRLVSESGEFNVSTRQVADGLLGGRGGPVAVAREVSKLVQAGAERVWPRQMW